METGEEIRRRLAMAIQKLTNMKFTWNGQDAQTKLRILRTCVFHIATHGCEALDTCKEKGSSI